jgi:nondiscriminating aspartyl-tRNA synthetase
MQRSLIFDCLQKNGEEVTISGFVQTVRSHGKIAFLDLRDMSGVLQVGGFGKDLATQMSALGQQDVVSITGRIKNREEKYINKASITGTIEMEAKTIEVLQKAAEMPFDMGGKTLELQLPTLLDYRSLALRHPNIASIFRMQAAVLKGFRTVAERLKCTEIVVPTIAASATEGGAEVFRVDYYDFKAYMTQSPQLYKQMMVPVFERVYTIAHAYRAEPSVTTRHLAETIQMDCEFGFVTFEELLDLLETVATEMVRFAQDSCEDILQQYNTEKAAFGKIPRLTLRQAQEIIYKETGRDSRLEKDLAPQDEVDICAWALKNHGSDFVTITHFPTKKRAFYSLPDPKDSEYCLSFDVLFKGVEICSGAQRINDYEQLVEAIKSRGMDPKNFGMYLQAFKYGMPPEGGFSFGLERVTMHMLNLHNIREASLYPRDMERVDERLSVIAKSPKKTT